MSNQAGLADLVREIKDASSNIQNSDRQLHSRIDQIETGLNDLFKRTGRPGAEWSGDGDERKSAIGLCQIHKSLVAEGDATAANYSPGSMEIQTAMLARQGLKALFRTGNVDRLEPEH